MARYCVLLLTCLWITPNPITSTAGKFSSIAVLAKHIIESGWTTLDDHSDFRLNKTTRQKQARMLQKIRNVGDVLWQLEQSISTISPDAFVDVIRSTTNNSRYEELFLEFSSYMHRIDADFQQLQAYSEDGNSSTMIDFARTAISRQPTSIVMFMKKIHQQIFPEITYESRGGLMKLLADNIDAFDEIVQIIEESPHQFLYNLFNKIALSQIKGYAVVQFSYVILEIHSKGYYLTKSKSAKTEIRDKLRTLLKETIRTTNKMSRHYWKSDPNKYKIGENYLEITKLLQGYVVHENLLDAKKPCRGTCENFKETKIVKCQKDPFCRQQTPCSGKVYNCQSLSSRNVQICPAHPGSTRRYNYIEYGNDDLLGEKSTCSAPIINANAWLGWCPYCMCFCDDEGFSSDRYFSLRQVISDTEQNKVVTGIRFVKKRRVIHLQVQQGEILPYGLINATSLEWVPIDEFYISDRYVYNKQDYMKVTWKDKTIDLHVVQVNDGISSCKEVLTGVRFGVVEFGKNGKNKRTHLNLEIRTTRFHSESGRLFANAHAWRRNLNTEFSPRNPRTRIPIENADIPTKARSRNAIISKGDHFVEFTHTDVFKDAGQTTVPFIDSQDVVTKAPTPLVGAGLYYKSSPGYGGFIGLKIVTYDFTQHL